MDNRVNKRILIVDDEPDFVFMTALTLQHAGPYEIRGEDVASHALPAALEFKPDVILLDVMMPDFDGGDVAAQLKAHPDTHAVPIVFLTALVDRDEALPGSIAAGGHRFLPKPVSVAELVQCIEEVTAAGAIAG